MDQLLKTLSVSVERHSEEAISFLQELIRTPSPSGNEAEVAAVTADKMREVGFDTVSIDSLNDVMGILSGSGGARSVLMNGHLDHVPVGGMLDPFSLLIHHIQILNAGISRKVTQSGIIIGHRSKSGAVYSSIEVKFDHGICGSGILYSTIFHKDCPGA